MQISLNLDSPLSSTEFLPLAAKGNDLSTYIRALMSGSAKGSLQLNAGVSASKAITCAFAAATVGDTLAIGGVELTAVASDPAADEFLIGASNAAMAANVAAALNASVPFAKAAVSGAVITVTSKVAGSIGNLIGVVATVDSGTPFSFSGAALSGGTDKFSLLSR